MHDIWNPWHGCKKVSLGCKNCFVYKMDQRYGRDTTTITKGKTTYELKDKDCPPNSLVKLCFSSDFFIEEADEWRDGCWDFIRKRKDCLFVMTTKRPERISQCVPSDWKDGWEHVLNKQKKNMKQEEIYIIFKKCSNLDLNFLKRFIEGFRIVNIVTNDLERLKNVQDNLLENDGILISVSNNKRKALKRAKYIFNTYKREI